MNQQIKKALKMAYKAEETGNLQDLIDAVNMLVDVVEALEQPEQEPVAWIKQGMDGYPKLVFNGKFEYESISAKWDDIALYTDEESNPQ